MPGSRVFEQAGASGLRVSDYQNLIHVNMLGQRFYDENGRPISRLTATTPCSPISPTSPQNAKNVEVQSCQLDSGGDGRHRRRQEWRRPIWAIFDSDAVAREKMDSAPPWVDVKNGFLLQRGLGSVRSPPRSR
jgi:hypothetical protein